MTPDRHVNLAERGVPKEYHTDYDGERASALFDDPTETGAELEATA